jgi:hypothetical protein
MSTEPVLKGPHARRRFTSHLQKIESLLNEALAIAHDGFPGQVIYQTGLRTPMFTLQGLARVYREFDIDDNLFERIRLECKIIEDAVGQVDFWAVMAKKSVEWSLPTGVQQLARERYVEMCGRAWAWVEAQDWITSRYHTDEELLGDKFIRKLKEADWLSPKKEAKVLHKWLINELHDIHEHMEALDLGDIELGLHEARREVRWVSIYFSAIAGGFALETSATPPPNWGRYLTEEIVSNPFNKLPEPEAEDCPLIVPAPLLYALSYLIDQLGRIKDKAQWTETASHLLHLTGEKADLSALMKDQYLPDETATKQGSELLHQVLVEDELLIRLAEGIRRE